MILFKFQQMWMNWILNYWRYIMIDSNMMMQFWNEIHWFVAQSKNLRVEILFAKLIVLFIVQSN